MSFSCNILIFFYKGHVHVTIEKTLPDLNLKTFHFGSYDQPYIVFCIRIYDLILQVKNTEEIGAWFLEPCNEKSKREGQQQAIKGILLFKKTLFCI